MNSEGFWIGLLIVGFIAVAIVGNLLMAQLPGEGRALRAAQNIGIDHPVVVKRQPAWEVLGGCKNHDVTKFTVRGFRNGKPVSIQVCAPWPFGGYTVRS